MGIIRDSFIIFKNWADAINALPEEYQLEAYKSLVAYGTSGQMPDDISQVTKALLISFSVGMENSICRYNASVNNGKLGGRPPKKKEELETQGNLEKPSITQDNLDEPTHNLNVNVNDNENTELVNKNYINKFKDEYNSACMRVRERTRDERNIYLKYYEEFFKYAQAEPWRSLAFEVIDTMIEASEQGLNGGLKFNQHLFTEKELGYLFAKIDDEHLRSIVTQLKLNQEINNRPYYIFGCIYKASQDTNRNIESERSARFLKDYSEKVCGQ